MREREMVIHGKHSTTHYNASLSVHGVVGIDFYMRGTFSDVTGNNRQQSKPCTTAIRLMKQQTTHQTMYNNNQPNETTDNKPNHVQHFKRFSSIWT